MLKIIAPQKPFEEPLRIILSVVLRVPLAAEEGIQREPIVATECLQGPAFLHRLAEIPRPENDRPAGRQKHVCGYTRLLLGIGSTHHNYKHYQTSAVSG